MKRSNLIQTVNKEWVCFAEGWQQALDLEKHK